MSLPQYKAQLSSRGEHHVAATATLSEVALVHKVASPADLGIDLFCEWADSDKPTQTLFTVQVKTPESQLREEVVNEQSNLNRLREVQLEIRYSGRWRNYNPIEKKTLNYKQGSLACKNPRELGLAEFPEEDAIFSEVVREYTPELEATAGKLRSLGLLTSDQANGDTIDPTAHGGFSGIVTNSLSHSPTISQNTSFENKSTDDEVSS